MSLIKEAERIVANMSTTERMEFLKFLMRYVGNISMGIEINPKICGGEPCIVRTRIPVWLLVRARQLGTSDADLLRNYPNLGAEDLANAWTYYLYHQDEIDQQIAENEAD
ncbi:MAG TPA: DUF433 domain-containing protein [Candidatus Lokiarchaeia archaeon]|nr:DUF433 domain-containing protein [Candidatus Lokiarchaeia archaeon]